MSLKIKLSHVSTSLPPSLPLTPDPLHSTTWTSEASALEDVATPRTGPTERTCPARATTPPRVGDQARRGTCDNLGWPAGARETLVGRASPSSSSKQESEDPGGPRGTWTERRRSQGQSGAATTPSSLPSCGAFTPSSSQVHRNYGQPY